MKINPENAKEAGPKLEFLQKTLMVIEILMEQSGFNYEKG
jgi:hypothetical protein